MDIKELKKEKEEMEERIRVFVLAEVSEFEKKTEIKVFALSVRGNKVVTEKDYVVSALLDIW